MTGIPEVSGLDGPGLKAHFLWRWHFHGLKPVASTACRWRGTASPVRVLPAVGAYRRQSGGFGRQAPGIRSGTPKCPYHRRSGRFGRERPGSEGPFLVHPALPLTATRGFCQSRRWRVRENCCSLPRSFRGVPAPFQATPAKRAFARTRLPALTPWRRLASEETPPGFRDISSVLLWLLGTRSTPSRHGVSLRAGSAAVS